MSDKLTYQQLMLLPSEQLTNDQRTFLNLHTEMVLAGQKAAECLLIVANDLKRMHDEKLYLAAGFEKFSDYVENALNIKERQAFTWISILKLPEEFLVKNADLGVTKLAAIASASEPIAAEIMEDQTAVSKSAKQLKEIIKAKEQELEAKNNQVSELESDYAELSDDFDKKEQELKEARARAEKIKAEACALEKALAEAKKAAKEVKTVPDEQSKRVAAAEKARADELEAKLKETNLQLAAAKEQKKTIASDDLLTFKIKFTDLQRLGGEIKKALDGMNEENAGKCRAAINAVLNGWKGDMKL